MVRFVLLKISNGQDVGSVHINLINSMINVSNTQFQRASEYINEYNQAVSQLSQVASKIEAAFVGINISPVQEFFANLRENLNENVQKLTEKYSPTNVQMFILGYYQTFLNNLLFNNGTQAEILSMNQLYYGKFLSPNASDCITRYNNLNYEIYSNASSNFTQTIEGEVSTTVDELESLRKEIKTLITNLVGNFEDIIADRATALQKLGTFVRINFCELEKGLKFPFQVTSTAGTLNTQISGWVAQFTTLMKQTQVDIKSSFNQFDGNRVNQTLALIQQTNSCLNEA